MLSSVSRITFNLQPALQAGAYACRMGVIDLTSAAGRIEAAIERSGKTLEQLADEIGCTHVALSHWKNGKTDIQAAKAGLLQRFAEATGTDVRWILTGQGPQVSRYILTGEMDRLAHALRAMEKSHPLQIETIVRMVEAAARQEASEPH